VQGLELAYFEDRSTGGLMAVLNDDVNQLERFLDVGANDILQVVATVVVVGGVLLRAAPAWPGAFLPIPVIVWGSFRFQRTLEPRYAEVRERSGLLNGSLGEQPRRASRPSRRSPPRTARSPASPRSPRLRGSEPRGDPALLGVRAADPDGDPGRLHRHPRPRRLPGARGQLEVGIYSVLVFMTSGCCGR
jgi:hypothetical protein